MVFNLLSLWVFFLVLVTYIESHTLFFMAIFLSIGAAFILKRATISNPEFSIASQVLTGLLEFSPVFGPVPRIPCFVAWDTPISARYGPAGFLSPVTHLNPPIWRVILLPHVESFFPAQPVWLVEGHTGKHFGWNPTHIMIFPPQQQQKNIYLHDITQWARSYMSSICGS